MKPVCREGVPSKATPVPLCHARGCSPRRRGQHILSWLCFSLSFVLAALFSQFCPGCAFLSALLSSRGDESRLGPAWLRGQSQVSRREPASYGFNILINFNTDAQMRVNHSAAVLSNLPSLFIKTFLPELWLNVMLFKGPLKQPGGFAGCCWNTFYNLLCKEECESALGEGWGTRLSEMLLQTPVGLKSSAQHQRYSQLLQIIYTVHMMLMLPFVI